MAKPRSMTGRKSRVRRPRHVRRTLSNSCTFFFDLGVDVGQASVKRQERDRAVAAIFDGQSPDLMTSDQLRGAAQMLVEVAADLTTKRLAIPVEPYLVALMSEKEREWYARTHPDDDIDLPLDDEGER